MTGPNLMSLAQENGRLLRAGQYKDSRGRTVTLGPVLAEALRKVRDIRPEEPITAPRERRHRTKVSVTEETPLAAGLRFHRRGEKSLLLNFANGIVPGGGYLLGAQAQEESLCRASALHEVIRHSPLYAYHQQHFEEDSTDWAIFSPGVPVFLDEQHKLLDTPLLLDFLSCAAPDKAYSGPNSEMILDQRIHRLFGIAHFLGYETLVLGAWGCGAFGNDPRLVSQSFRRHLDGDYRGVFHSVVFAILDSSPERRFLGPFERAFSAPTLDAVISVRKSQRPQESSPRSSPDYPVTKDSHARSRAGWGLFNPR